jgi:hypothetical protein
MKQTGKILTLAEVPRTYRPTQTAAKWKRCFLYALSKSPNVTEAARYAGVHRDTCYQARDRDPVFEQKWKSTIEAAIDKLEGVAFRRAEDGDSNVLTFLLKCRRGRFVRRRGLDPCQKERAGVVNEERSVDNLGAESKAG